LLFYSLIDTRIILPIASTALLASINIVLLVLIVFERTTWRMSAADKALFAHFTTLTPGQFRRLRRDMHRETLTTDTPLAFEGQPLDDLMLVFSNNIRITKGGDSFPIAGPAFVGEVAFLTGNPSSASVSLPDGGMVVRLNIEAVQAKMARSPSLNNAMVALFGRELARKVADSVPMARAAKARRAVDHALPNPADDATGGIM